jgi:hypothetical protein
MALDKIETMLEWPKLKCKHDVQMFLGFTNICRPFFGGFGTKINAIMDLLRNGVPYELSHKCAKGFQAIKAQPTKAPILLHFEPTCQIVVETDASDFTIRAVLSQVIDRR